MGAFAPYAGMPGASAERIAKHRTVSADGYLTFLPGGRILDGPKTRDPDNPDYPTNVLGQSSLRAGLLLGKIAATNKYANAVIGVTAGALAAGGTTITISAAEAVELNRRLALSAATTFKLTGPPVASGVVRTNTITFSAINTTTGVVTITAPGVNEAQTLNFQNAPAGTFNLGIVDLNGAFQDVGPITYSATIATLVANINTALNNALGASLVVASGTLVTAVALTFSGAGYAALPQSLVTVDANNLTAGNVSVTRTTAGVDGRFVAGSWVGDIDGSATPLTFLPDGWETFTDGTGADNPFPRVPNGGQVDDGNLLPLAADPSLRQFVRTSLNAAGVGLYQFTSLL